ncbi:hypothetical protein [Synechococcus sp. RSCCF101]|uniref:hypothetical protein n=1 Tax=Synechococcus sp. RSCCF101 TaxID=2511069 RepID=UPI001783AB70|nr:hypothetical protein [Synechococcus sp. RSCCF101]
MKGGLLALSALLAFGFSPAVLAEEFEVYEEEVVEEVVEEEVIEEEVVEEY